MGVVRGGKLLHHVKVKMLSELMVVLRKRASGPACDDGTVPVAQPAAVRRNSAGAALIAANTAAVAVERSPTTTTMKQQKQQGDTTIYRKADGTLVRQ